MRKRSLFSACCLSVASTAAVQADVGTAVSMLLPLCDEQRDLPTQDRAAHLYDAGFSLSDDARSLIERWATSHVAARYPTDAQAAQEYVDEMVESHSGSEHQYSMIAYTHHEFENGFFAFWQPDDSNEEEVICSFYSFAWTDLTSINAMFEESSVSSRINGGSMEFAAFSFQERRLELGPIRVSFAADRAILTSYRSISGVDEIVPTTVLHIRLYPNAD